MFQAKPNQKPFVKNYNSQAAAERRYHHSPRKHLVLLDCFTITSSSSSTRLIRVCLTTSIWGSITSVIWFLILSFSSSCRVFPFTSLIAFCLTMFRRIGWFRKL